MSTRKPTPGLFLRVQVAGPRDWRGRLGMGLLRLGVRIARWGLAEHDGIAEVRSVLLGVVSYIRSG